jgi:hypothetical protein
MSRIRPKTNVSREFSEYANKANNEKASFNARQFTTHALTIFDLPNNTNQVGSHGDRVQ